MIFSLPDNWSLQFFPQIMLFPGSKSDLLPKILLLFTLFSLLYLFAMWLSARFCTTRRRGFGTGISSGYIVTVLLASLAIATRANEAVYTPFFQFVALCLFHAGIIFSLVGSWLIHRKEAEHPASLAGFVRGGYWFSLLTTSLLWLVIFLQVPVVSTTTRTIFLEPVILALLLYFMLNRLLVKQGHKWLGLAVSAENLSGNLGERFHSFEKFVADFGDYPLILLGSGFRNAVALYPQKQILVGYDLLVHLDNKEIQAILLHEIGHLKDKKYIISRHHLNQILPFVMVAFIVLDQSGVFASQLVRIGVLVTGLISFSMLFKQLRLKGEFVADMFVKGYPGDFHRYLLSGIDRMTRLNGLDKDFCKKNNHPHLDLDERRDMVENGRFAMKRKSARRFFLTMVTFMVLGVVFQLGWSRVFPSPAKQWNTLHHQYHQLFNERNFADADQVLEKVLSFSLEKFGETNRRTYLLFKDCTNLRLKQKNRADAERCILRAGKIGEQLYGEESLKRTGELRILAWIREKQGHTAEAENLYQKIVNFQKKFGDTPYNISRTLYSLAAIVGTRAEEIAYYQQIVELYKKSEPGTDDSPSEYIFSDLAEMYANDGLPDKAESLLIEAVSLIREKKGEESEEYGNSVWELANFLRDQQHFDRAENQYKQCIELASGWEAYIGIGCRYGLAENYRLQNQLDKAEKELRQALYSEENLYGKDSEELVYGLNELASIVKELGRQEESEKIMLRAKNLVPLKK